MASWRLILMAVCIALTPVGVRLGSAAGLDRLGEEFRTGLYEQCLESAQKEASDGTYGPDRSAWIVKSLMALGRYSEAAQEMDAALQNDPMSIRLTLLAHTAYQYNGQPERAALMLARVYRIATARRLGFISSLDLVALGDALLRLGGEPRIILGEFFDQAMQRDPNCREAYLAVGDLAMAKQDYDLAATQYRKALERFGDDPDAHAGLAKAFYPSDRQAMIKALDAALHVNPRHTQSLILLAEHQIDSEDYDGAAKTLDRTIAVNPWHPETWALRCVLAHMANDPNAVKECRAKALQSWQTNPQVDFVIGRKLSQKYRFAEGAMYQQQALRYDTGYLPAKGQLVEDLLRLGEEQEGWKLAQELYAKDPYNVNAYNLLRLHDNLSKFKTLSVEGFTIRIDSLEAEVYGDRVARVLGQARSQLCRKYGLSPEGTVTVELFTNQQDFAVRTFGMPGGDGFLGVCFGRVITANSPRLQRPANWEAMLWHEYCHVVTLTLTGNKMPRWLSEGISVYEELQRNPSWGQRMIPPYRKMVLGGELVPIGELSGAFLNPPTAMHLQFAYYESSLVVEFLVDRFGLASLKAVLADLAKGDQINAAISRNAVPLETLEPQFEAFARRRAEGLAPDVDWEEPEKEKVDRTDAQAVAQWLAGHPSSFWALQARANQLLAERRWEDAKGPLGKQISLYPQYTGEGNAYQLLAQVHHQLGETQQEGQVLDKLATLSADAADAYGRMMEIGIEQKDWRQVLRNGDRYLAVYPLLSAVHWRMGLASEGLGQEEQAVESYRRVLLLDPSDPVEVNYRMACLLQQRDPAAAKRYVLNALADAPRFRNAHRLLLRLGATAGNGSAVVAPVETGHRPAVQEDVQ